jgi:pimeloyl-ACP methyl ester carboxylesterase
MSASMHATSNYLRCAGREIHFMDWPAATHASSKGTVIAWHGLARTGRDMDTLAQYLAGQGWRVICPDTIGRGLSQWSPAPAQEYQLSFYAQLAAELVGNLGLQSVHWVGTSMGGAIGMVAAAGPLRERIASLVLNDTAPQVAQAAIERIKAFYRQAYKPFGWLSDAQWRSLTETSTRRLPDGRVTPHYDPAMVQQFVLYPNDYLLWTEYDSLDIPMLCLRGEHSDLVLRETVQEMPLRGPGAKGLLQVVEVPDCGHAPALNVPQQMELVAGFLARASVGV